VEPQATLQDALNQMLNTSHGAVVVVDGAGAYLGTVDFATVATAIQQMRDDTRTASRARLSGPAESAAEVPA
jgi:osmoprotectant transport system ATP-binding protein